MKYDILKDRPQTHCRVGDFTVTQENRLVDNKWIPKAEAKISWGSGCCYDHRERNQNWQDAICVKELLDDLLGDSLQDVLKQAGEDLRAEKSSVTIQVRSK